MLPAASVSGGWLPYYKQREQEGAFDRATLRAMGDLGLFGVELPEEYGGLGLDCTTAGLVLEAICRSDYNLGQLMVTISLSGAIMARHGDPAVVAPWLRGVTAGEMIPAIALTEPGGGSDAANLTLRATKDGASYILDGEKTSTSFATQAEFAIVWARTGAHPAVRAESAPSSSPWTCRASRPASSTISAVGAPGGGRSTLTAS